MLEQLGGDSPLGSQHDAILGKDTDGGTGVGDGLKSVLDLVETTFWGEDSRLGSNVSCWSFCAAWHCKLVVVRMFQSSPGSPTPTYSGIVSSRHGCRGSLDRLEDVDGCKVEDFRSNGSARVQKGEEGYRWCGGGVCWKSAVWEG